jgi:hypothetical protein
VLGGIALGRGDRGGFHHAVDYPVPPGAGGVGVVVRVVVGGRFRQGRQHGILRDAEVVERLVEIGLRRGGDAVAALAEIDFVEI